MDINVKEKYMILKALKSYILDNKQYNQDLMILYHKVLDYDKRRE